MLKIISQLYGFSAYVRRFLYNKGIINRKKLPVPVVSIGNLSVGGTGKTPLTIFLAKNLQKKGHTVAVLSRGYRRKSKGTVVVRNRERLLTGWEDAGDEPYLIALNGIPIVVSNSRYQAGKKAIKEINPDIFILDDGFQHFQLYRDLDILVFDAMKPFWEDRLLPVGRLREPVYFYRFADIIVVNRLNKSKNPDEITEFLKKTGKKFFISREYLKNITNLKDEKELSFLKGKKIGIFSGLGNNEQFFDTVERLSKDIGFEIVEKRSFPDHYDYTRLHLSSKPDIYLTTEKDIIKIRQNLIDKHRIYAVKYSLELDEEFVNYLEEKIFSEKIKNEKSELENV
ncbi:tetraacyldisaccharide 4'-kinase [Persephonella sp.]